MPHCKLRIATLACWLSVVPLKSHHFNLSSQEFWDALTLRYQKPLLSLPFFCDGCNAPFSVEHALDCRVGMIGDLAALV